MFEQILGNNKIKKVLEKSIQENKILHSYMFIGIQGIGKKIIAKEFAKNILCLNRNRSDKCNECKSCIEFENGNQPDFYYIGAEGGKIKIDTIRNLQTKIYEKPIISNKKVYIINDADTMTQEAQNCLLKTLEEPPEFVTIILIGTNENNFLATIKSRCMIMHFDPIKDEYVKKYMEENYELKNINEDMLYIFQGSIGKAICLRDKIQEYLQLEEIIKNMKKMEFIEFYKKCEWLYNNKEQIYLILDFMSLIFLKLSNENIDAVKGIYIIEDTKKRLNKSSNYDMCIDNLLFNIYREKGE